MSKQYRISLHNDNKYANYLYLKLYNDIIKLYNYIMIIYICKLYSYHKLRNDMSKLYCILLHNDNTYYR